MPWGGGGVGGGRRVKQDIHSVCSLKIESLSSTVNVKIFLVFHI